MHRNPIPRLGDKQQIRRPLGTGICIGFTGAGSRAANHSGKPGTFVASSRREKNSFTGSPNAP